MEPELRFATNRRGKRIAYTIGGDGPPFVHVPGWVSHQGSLWQVGPFALFLRRLAEQFTVLTYDKLGTGLSDRERSEYTLDSDIDELRTVVDHAHLRRFALLGLSEGGPCAIGYAARYPRHVSKLVLFATYANGPAIATPEQRDAFIALVRGNWGLASRSLADILMPGADLEQLANYFRGSATPEVAVGFLEYIYRVDVTNLLSRVKVPTLVVHGTKDRAFSFRLGRELAAGLPNAHLLAIEGMHHVPSSPEHEVAFMDALLAFLADEASKGEPANGASVSKAEEPALQTILFTDIEGHTPMMQRLGDASGREVLREHERITREQLLTHGGREVKAMGDGFMASFGSAQRALECAIALQNAFAGRIGAAEPIRVRVGINAGEPISEDDDLFGSAVILAARTAANAQGGEILVTNVVRELVAGKSFLFSDRGETVLRGFEDPVRLYEVGWQ